jgi:DNA-binding PadR family transcriptional regulator
MVGGHYGHNAHSQDGPMARAPAPQSFLPLKAADFEILFSLFGSEMHGYAIVKSIARRTEGRVLLEPSHLYRRIRHLVEDGLVEESEERPTPELDDERRRYFALTPLGRSVLAAEAERMRDLVTAAESVRLLAAN